MPYSKEHNLFFIHIPKAAGSTIEKALDIQYEECFYKEQKYPKHNVCPQHLTLKELELICPGLVASCELFTVVRNPFDRLVSEYCHIKTRKNWWAKKYFDLNFNEFVVAAFNTPQKERIYNFDGHIETQHSYIEGINNSKVNIFKFEELTICFDWLNKKTKKTLKFAHERKSEREHYSVYYTDKNTIELVKNFYEIDFNYFNYNKSIK